MRGRLACGAILVVLSCTTAAFGDDTSAAAERLFSEGRALMLAGRLEEACPMLAESQRLDPGVGTLLNLGECYEKSGRTASAWAAFKEAEGAAKRQNQRERAAYAEAKAGALESRLPQLVVKVPASLHATVSRDGVTLGPSSIGTPLPVDPGRHEIVVRAPGREEVRRVVVVAEGQVSVVEVADLAPLPAQGRPAPPPVASHAAPRQGGAQRVLGLGLTGLGVVALGFGTFWGLSASSKNDEARAEHCSDVDCSRRGVELLDEAGTAADLSSAAFIAGGVFVAGGLALFFTAPSGGSSVAVTPRGLAWSTAF